MSKIPLDDILESLYKLRKRESDQHRTVLEFLRHGDSSEDIGSELSHQKISVRNYQKLKNHGEEKYRSQTSITKLWCQAWAHWARSSDKGSEVIVWRWRRKRYLLPVERKRPVFARRPLQFPTRNPESCAKNREHCRHTFCANRITRSKCVEEEVSEAKVTWINSRRPCRFYSKGTCTRTSCDYWYPPECHFYQNETGCTAGDKCLFPHCKVDEQPKKKPPKKSYFPKRESDDKNAVAIAKSVSQLGCVSQDSEALVSRGIPMQNVLEPMQRVRFTKSTLRQASIREKKGPLHGKNKCQTSSSAKSQRFEIWAQVPWRDWTTAMCPKQGLQSC